MTIQPLLLDVLKFMAIGKVETIVGSPEANATKFATFEPDQSLILTGQSHEPMPGASVEFGLFNFKILKGLLSMGSFTGDKASIALGTRSTPEGELPDRIEFKGSGTKAVFRLMNRAVLPSQPELSKIPWDITILNTDNKLAEFQQMAALYGGESDPSFRLRTESGNLVADFGTDSAATHAASMILQEDVGTDIAGDLEFDIGKFILMLKTASAAKAMDIKVLSRGLLGIVAVTDHAVYTYLLKKNM